MTHAWSTRTNAHPAWPGESAAPASAPACATRRLMPNPFPACKGQPPGCERVLCPRLCRGKMNTCFETSIAKRLPSSECRPAGTAQRQLGEGLPLICPGTQNSAHPLLPPGPCMMAPFPHRAELFDCDFAPSPPPTPPPTADCGSLAEEVGLRISACIAAVPCSRLHRALGSAREPACVWVHASPCVEPPLPATTCADLGAAAGREHSSQGQECLPHRSRPARPPCRTRVKRRTACGASAPQCALPATPRRRPSGCQPRCSSATSPA